MQKPVDPRKQGLKEPQKVSRLELTLPIPWNKDQNIYQASREYPLEALVNIWNKALKDHESQGHRIVVRPAITDRGLIKYTIEIDNAHYSDEMACYSAALNEYAEQCRQYGLYEQNRKKHEQELNLAALDNKIARLKERLANLEAVKAGGKFVNGKLITDETV